MSDRQRTGSGLGLISETGSPDLSTSLVGGIGLLLLGLSVWHVATSHLAIMVDETSTSRLIIEWVELIFMLAPPFLLFLFAKRQHKRATPSEDRWIMIRWTLVGLVVVVGVIIALRIHWVLLGLPVRPSILVMEVLTGAGAGAVLGLVVGTSRLEGLRRSSTIEEQRNAFLFVNRVLRHNVLNGMNLIAGYTAKLESSSDPQVRRVQEMVAERSRELTDLIENVGAIVRTYTGSEPLEPIDLADIVQAECDRVRDLHPSATIEVMVPERAMVDATPLLPMVVRNLLENAVEHAARPGEPVAVTVGETATTVTLEISDRGEGIDDVSRYLGPGDRGDRGTGLYLAERALTQLDGSLSIDDSESGGTVVTVELPATTDAEIPTGLTPETLSLPSLWQ